MSKGRFSASHVDKPTVISVGLWDGKFLKPDTVQLTEIPFDVINSEEKRDEAILKAIKDILGTPFQSANQVF